MMFLSRMFLFMLLVLGLTACPDDEDEGDDAKYTLKVAKPSSPAVGADISVEVKLYNGDAIVKDDDAKAAKDADVTGSIKCKEMTAKVDATKGKFDAAGKATLTINIADNSDKSATAVGTKGYTDCVVSAATEFGDDKTKASGDSDKFTVAAKSADTGAGNGDDPEFPDGGIAEGKEFSITNGEGAKISLVGANSGACSGDNFLFKVGNPVLEISGEHTIGATDEFFVIGDDCEVKVSGITENEEVDEGSGNPGIGAIVRNVGTGTNKLGITLSSVTTAPTAGTAKLFVKAGASATAWVPVVIPNGHAWNADTQVVSTIEADTTAANTNRVLFNIADKWSYSKG